jgi:hypothetical protein
MAQRSGVAIGLGIGAALAVELAVELGDRSPVGDEMQFHRAPFYFPSGTPFVVKRCVLPSRTGRRVPAALPVPAG